MSITAHNPPSLAAASLIAALNPGIGVLYYEKGTLGYVYWQDGETKVTELSSVN